MINIKTILRIICRASLLCFVALLCSCTAAENLQTKAYVAPNENITIITENEYKSYEERKTEKSEKVETSKTRANTLSTAINEMDLIATANVVITGNTAIVGITLDSNLEDSKIISLKREIENLVKSIDEKIDNVAVTSASDLVDRIKKLQEEKTDTNTNDTVNQKTSFGITG